MAKLLVQETNGAREFELVDREVNIGRELDNALRLADPSVSRHHAVVRQNPDGFEIEDLGSSNGVLLNGARVPSGPLRDGDRITLGQMQVTFVDPPAASPLGTVRMDAEAMAQFRARTREATQAALAATAAPAPPAPPVPEPAPPEPHPTRPVVLVGKPGPAFLHPWLPDIPDPAEPVTGPDGSVQRGDLLTRGLAALIDGSPLLVLGLAATALSAGLLPAVAVLVMLANLALSVAYLILMPLFWMRCGASPGKKLMKLRVVPEGDPHGRLDLNGALLRLVGYLANGAIAWILHNIVIRLMVAFGFLGLFSAGSLLVWSLDLGLLSLVFSALPYLLILRPDRRALEDLFSRSVVIKVDR
jgi:uncharacterized RDD family membrane protein YckC